MATLQATTAACDAAIGLGQVTPAIDPFTGWATTTGILAGLILATHTTTPPDLGPLDTPRATTRPPPWSTGSTAPPPTRCWP